MATEKISFKLKLKHTTPVDTEEEHERPDDAAYMDADMKDLWWYSVNTNTGRLHGTRPEKEPAEFLFEVFVNDGAGSEILILKVYAHIGEYNRKLHGQ